MKQNRWLTAKGRAELIRPRFGNIFKDYFFFSLLKMSSEMKKDVSEVKNVELEINEEAELEVKKDELQVEKLNSKVEKAEI